MVVPSPSADLPSLAELETWASARGLLLRLQPGQRLGIRSLRVGVARRQAGVLQLLAELKGWALPLPDGLQLDTLRVQGDETAGVAALTAAAAMAWALEVTPCRRARILAIHDDDRQHRRLVRYFQGLGFTPGRAVGAAPADLPLRLVWGGAGLLMAADCAVVLARCWRRLQGLGPPPA
jgi:hypothetical protein